MMILMYPKPEPRPLGTFRVGDYVEVANSVRVTSLGEGRIIDISTDRNGLPIQALVRFVNGPAGGVWYSLGNLTRLRDYRGDSA